MNKCNMCGTTNKFYGTEIFMHMVDCPLMKERKNIKWYNEHIDPKYGAECQGGWQSILLENINGDKAFCKFCSREVGFWERDHKMTDEEYDWFILGK